jgi:hypothetical protein
MENKKHIEGFALYPDTNNPPIDEAGIFPSFEKFDDYWKNIVPANPNSIITVNDPTGKIFKNLIDNPEIFIKATQNK